MPRSGGASGSAVPRVPAACRGASGARSVPSRRRRPARRGPAELPAAFVVSGTAGPGAAPAETGSSTSTQNPRWWRWSASSTSAGVYTPASGHCPACAPRWPRRACARTTTGTARRRGSPWSPGRRTRRDARTPPRARRRRGRRASRRAAAASTSSTRSRRRTGRSRSAAACRPRWRRGASGSCPAYSQPR